MDSVKRGFASVGCQTFTQVKEGFISALDNQQSKSFSEKGHAPTNEDFVNNLSLKEDEVHEDIVNKVKWVNKVNQVSLEEDDVHIYKGQSPSNLDCLNKCLSKEDHHLYTEEAINSFLKLAKEVCTY